LSRNVRVGMIVNTQGLRGEVRVYPLTDYKERFEELDHVYLENESNDRLNIEKVKYRKNLVILKFKNYDSINDVEKFKDLYLYIKEDDLRKLPKDTYYIIDLIGSMVYDSEDNLLGELIDVIQNTAQDIYVINLEKENKEILIPAVKEFIKYIDIENKIIKVNLIEGMLS